MPARPAGPREPGAAGARRPGAVRGARSAAPVAALASALLAAAAAADPPTIAAAEAHSAREGWVFTVTLAHPDTGWDHYADSWSVEAPDGTELGVRELLHPHETEQPFTRSLSRVAVPEEIAEVTIRARCSVDGWSGEPFTVALSR